MVRIRLYQPLVRHLRIQYLLIIPVLLALGAALTLTFHGDVNAPLLYSQCHARSRLPAISRVPVLGSPICFLVSFFMFARASTRGVVQLSVLLAFLGALLTVSRVEAARACNRRSWTIRSPTLSWLVFNLVGGTSFVWDLWIVPVFLKNARDSLEARAEEAEEEFGPAGGDLYADEERIMLERSFMTCAEVYAIPAAVAIGFIVPSILMLVLGGAVSVIVWLFFPLWVAIVHWAVECVAVKLLLTDNGPLHLESHLSSITLVYAFPVISSLLTHALFIWSLFGKDHSREMTHMALKFMRIDFIYIAATVLYWLFAESGIIAAALLVVFSVPLGPGAALCVAWLVREKAICTFAVTGEDESDKDSDGDDSTVHEDTPLLN